MQQKIIILLFFFVVKLSTAAVSVPHFFSDHMVLQRDAKIPVWGFADPNEKVTVMFKISKKLLLLMLPETGK